MKLFRRHKWLYLAILLWMVLGSACTPLELDNQGQINAAPLSISAGQSIGQTLTTSYAGLVSMDFYFVPQSPGNGTLNLTLFDNVREKHTLAQSSLSIASITKEGWYSLVFDQPPSLESGNYYARLEIAGTGALYAASAEGNLYLNGSAYRNDAPLPNQQLAFKLDYRTRWLVEGYLP